MLNFITAMQASLYSEIGMPHYFRPLLPVCLVYSNLLNLKKLKIDIFSARFLTISSQYFLKSLSRKLGARRWIMSKSVIKRIHHRRHAGTSPPPDDIDGDDLHILTRNIDENLIAFLVEILFNLKQGMENR